MPSSVTVDGSALRSAWVSTMRRREMPRAVAVTTYGWVSCCWRPSVRKRVSAAAAGSARQSAGSRRYWNAMSGLVDEPVRRGAAGRQHRHQHRQHQDEQQPGDEGRQRHGQRVDPGQQRVEPAPVGDDRDHAQRHPDHHREQQRGQRQHDRVDQALADERADVAADQVRPAEVARAAAARASGRTAPAPAGRARGRSGSPPAPPGSRPGRPGWPPGRPAPAGSPGRSAPRPGTGSAARTGCAAAGTASRRGTRSRGGSPAASTSRCRGPSARWRPG